MNADAALGRGSYPIGEAARLSQMPPRTVRRWIAGYPYDYKGTRRRSEPIAFLELTRGSDRRGDEVLDFEQLLTLLLVRAFHQGGLSLQKIKQAAARARDLYELDNPFVSKAFRSDGSRVFVELAAGTRGTERHMIDVLSDQRQFREIVEPSLFKDVVFVSDRAGEWRPLGIDRHVAVNPRVQFGAPHVRETGVRTDVVAQMHAAEGGDTEAVQEWFGLTQQQVSDAVEFEGEWSSQN